MDYSKKPEKKNPKKGANFISQLLFLWFIPILWKGKNKGLNTDDVTVCLKQDQSKDLGDKLEREWKKQINKSDKTNRKTILRRALFNTFFPSIILDGFLIFIYIISRTLTPLVLGQLLIQFQQTNTLLNENLTQNDTTNNLINQTEQFHDAKNISTSSNEIFTNFEYIWNDKLCLSILIIVTTCAGAFLFNHSDLRQRWVGARMRIACSSLIYRKTLRLSNISVGKAGTGYLINLLSNDVSRFDQGFRLLHYVWILPIQSILTCYLLWRDIGAAAFVGVTVLLLITISVLPALSRLLAILRSKVALRSGKRIGIMNEIIQGIQVIKMYAWEKSFMIIIDKIREREMKQIRFASYVRGISLNTKIFSARITLFITIVVVVLLGKPISANIIYSTAQYLQYLEITAAIYYTHALLFASEALVAIERIQEFLLFDEKNEKVDGFTHNKMNKNNTNLLKNVEYSIQIKNITASWNNNDIGGTAQLTLNNILLNVRPGQLCAIIGPVGSGKTSLLHLLLGELPIITGNCIINGDISYASQEPWLFSDTIKNNILFGEQFDPQRYNKVIECCALNTDLKELPNGDHTMVGERGMSLSGGQRARVSLARAIYKTSVIYLLDDPLSAVDVHVGKFLYDKIIGPNGCLANDLKATRLLVTHQVHFLKTADVIIVLENGIITQKGSYVELENSNFDFSKRLDISNKLEINDMADELENQENTDENEQLNTLAEELPLIENNEKTLIGILKSKPIVQESPKLENKINDKKEKQAEGHISINVWKQYFQASGNIFAIYKIIIIFILSQIIISGSDYFVNYWTQIEFLRQHNNAVTLFSTYRYLSIYGVIILAVVLICFLRSYVFLNIVLKSSTNLHKAMFINLINAPMTFFNENPPGRILNRFSKDIGGIDELVPRTMSETISILLIIIGIIVLVVIVNPVMIITLIVSTLLYACVLRFNLKSSQDLKRVEGITKSPVFSYVSTTIAGLSVIRARNLQTKLCTEFDSLQNVHSAVWQLTTVSTTSLGLWLDCISSLFSACVTLSFLSLENTTFSGNVGMAITQSLYLTGAVQYGIKQIAETIQHMICTERVIEYTNLEQEYSPDKKPTINWPENGTIQFNNISLKYSKTASDIILKNIQIDIESNWKVGIVGRTGAGKSSLINALFRLPIIEGEILIDGLDTGLISLESLRSKISIIPQDPFLFSASVRYNLDPFGVYDDFQLWKALANVELRNSILSLDDMITEGGNNFSIGQRQLLCLARAMLRNNKILILDEATANVDPQTDELIQQTIRNKFNNCTILMIAHRLHTVIDADRIIVMDNGEVKEFDIPYLLLENTNTLLWEMINATGPQESEYLKNVAYEKYVNMKK